MEPEFGPWLKRGYDQTKTWLADEERRLGLRRLAKISVGLGLTILGTTSLFSHTTETEKPLPAGCVFGCPTSLPKIALAPHVEAKPTTVPPKPSQLPKPTTTRPTPTTLAPHPSISTTTEAPTLLNHVHAAAALATKYPSHTLGLDVSWPQCDNAWAVPTNVEFGIIGLTHGKNFTINKCVGALVSHFKQYSLYLNADNFNRETDLAFYKTLKKPRQNCDPATTRFYDCVAYDRGFEAGVEGVDVGFKVDVMSREYWLDVETGNTWEGNVDERQQSIKGEMDGIQVEAGQLLGLSGNQIITGIYTAKAMWETIAGNEQLPDTPLWQATGDTSANATAYCNNKFTGGPVWIVQGGGGVFDEDRLCPQAPAWTP